MASGQATDGTTPYDVIVVGFGGPGDLELTVDCDPALAGLCVLPALQVLGERAAQAKGVDTVSPRHLTKVVMLG